MKTYLTKTKYNTYRYIRRVPQELLVYTPSHRFRVSLGSNELEATQRAVEFNSAIEDALQLFQLQLPPNTIIEKLEQLLPQETMDDKPIEVHNDSFIELTAQYINSQEANISADETRDKKYFYEEVCSAIFEYIGLSSNPVVTSIEFKHLLDFKAIVTQLPKRNIHKYRTMPLSDIFKQLNSIDNNDKISARTVNKYIKWLRALFNFAVMLNHLQVNLANSLPLQKAIDDKLQRLPLDDVELKLLLQSLPHKMKYLVQILSLTGMRLSELYKCNIQVVDGIKCFSLMDRELKLKTKSSYRIIPVHVELIGDLDGLDGLRQNVSADYLARTVSNAIKSLDFEHKEKKSLYSLRHSFATKLIQLNANASIVSELMGHTHSTMTLSRYSTGFSVKQLREVVELL